MVEMKNNRSRIVFNVPNKTKTDMKAASEKNEEMDLGYLITTNDEQAKVTPSPSTLLFDAIESAVSSTLKRFFALSSSAYNADITGSGDASTATEQNLSNSGQINSIDCTRSSINAKMSLFIKKMCEAAGFKDPEFTFSMNQNTSITQRELLDETVMKITHGLMGRRRILLQGDRRDHGCSHRHSDEPATSGKKPTAACVVAGGGSARHRNELMKPNCHETQAQVYQYLDSEMGPYRRWRVRRHLRRCPPCTDGFSFESNLKRKIRKDCVDDVPEELLTRIKTFVRQNGSTDTSAGPTAGGSDV